MGTIKVTAPNPEYTGAGPAGVEFTHGEAEVDTSNVAALSYFRDAGYTVETPEPAEPAKPPRKSPSKPAAGKSE